MNAGQANAVTGLEGLADTEASAEAVGRELSIGSEDVLVMSTGVIGHRIKMENLLHHIPQLTESLSSSQLGDLDVARAITTTGIYLRA